MFKESSGIIPTILCTLFNYMYSNNVYPSVWAKGVIVPVPNKGDPNNVNNYRGITLTSIFSQIFSILLDNRLRVWSESSNLLSDFQFDFRKSKSTFDCIFVISPIIDKVLNHEMTVVMVFKNTINVLKMLKCRTITKYWKLLNVLPSWV